ncbi:hypothetical protein [Stackebrandtia nassauensis]|uniref:Uncharacterized protein n=1 Tax=Stackebrandtia nassauensis (strain DSM 44728 / CIP 108903 / NRRL B-16338 / NBRC 102104 / LLR-40K-21) TaxID=446470 RepID=D3Q7R7_STANL|nr:hypothetical protein [Stackebrandtia nassauensis]ADD44409.1 hypothetical protein Snas_4767 [Stackebrandtia nassauensis DSM 44728]
MNEVTGGDLAYLRKIADEHVPAIATRLGDARLKLVELLALGDETFQHEDEVGHDNEPAVPWEYLRDTISRILLVNENRLWSVRDAVNQAIGDFLDTDRANASGVATAADLIPAFEQQDAGIGAPDPVTIPDPRLTDLSLGDDFDDVVYRPE